MTLETLRFLRELCNRVTLRAIDPGFEADAYALIAAMKELDKALQEIDV